MPTIETSPRDRPPFAVELTVFEEDTFLVMSAGNFARDVHDSVDELVGRMSTFEPPAPGEVVVRGNRAYAIVHDLEQKPTCRREWVDAAIENLVKHCEDNLIRAIAVQPLGCVHGDGRVDDFERALTKRLAGSTQIERVWIVTG